MKALFLLCAGLACASLQAEEDRYLLLSEFLPLLTQDVMPGELVYADGAASVVRVPASKVARWAHQIHDHYGACGGFMDVTHRVREGTSAERLVWESSDSARTPQPRFQFTVRGEANVADLVDLVDKNSYWTFLTALEAMGSRSATNESGTKAAAWIREKAQSLSSSIPGVQIRAVATEHFFANTQDSIVVTIEGTEPQLPGIVLGAHMDTTSQMFSSKQPGADDDGSGSALLLETLRVLNQSGVRLERTVHLVWYAAEEWGLVGSQFVVEDFIEKGIEVDAVLQFDMVAYNSPKDDENIYLLSDYTNSELTETLKRVIETYTDAVVGTTACGYACSDHASWHKKGFAAAAPFEASFANMNGRLHTQNDKSDVLDLDHAIRFVKAAVAFVGEFGRMAEPARD